ncbi:MAG: hypothetical protein AAF637_14325 [Pseudomonadota bacterium]
MPIRLTCGTRQQFRYRYRDITIRGQIDGLDPPVSRAAYSLNDGPETEFYVEEIPDDGIDWVNGYKSSPAELRCRDLGEFCIEIAITAPALRPGENRLAIWVEDARGTLNTADLTFGWDPAPLPLPLDLRDLTAFDDIQQVGQIVNGAFDLDRKQNVIRSRAPVAPDAYMALGSPHGSQEATYAVRFLDLGGAKWLGLADFFVGLEEGRPERGIKVGWSSAGMAALSPRGEARSFIAWGDHSAQLEEWAIATHPPATVNLQRGVLYRVRHQLAFANGVTRVRYRIWPADQDEPSTWLCEEQDSQVPEDLPRHSEASFGLFQHMGGPIEWSDIVVNAHEPDDPPVMAGGRKPFLGRDRPGAF